jgi:hypothetical protein
MIILFYLVENIGCDSCDKKCLYIFMKPYHVILLLTEVCSQPCSVKYYKRGNISGGHGVTPPLG